jgi:hypothetical protein
MDPCREAAKMEMKRFLYKSLGLRRKMSMYDRDLKKKGIGIFTANRLEDDKIKQILSKM